MVLVDLSNAHHYFYHPRAKLGKILGPCKSYLDQPKISLHNSQAGGQGRTSRDDYYLPFCWLWLLPYWNMG